MSKPVIYIAGPYRNKNASGIFANIMDARESSANVWSAGAIAVCPHLNTFLFDGVKDLPDSIWLYGDLEILKRCDAAYFFKGIGTSEGTKAEYEFCLQHKMPALFSMIELINFIQNFDKELGDADDSLGEYDPTSPHIGSGI